MQNEEVLTKVIETLHNVIEKIDTINKRLIIALSIAVISFCITLMTVAGFYFLQGYPDYSQTVTGQKVEQSITKGGD
jgi:hypothetical protein